MNDDTYEHLVLVSLESIQNYTNLWLAYLGRFRDCKITGSQVPDAPSIVTSMDNSGLPCLFVDPGSC